MYYSNFKFSIYYYLLINNIIHYKIGIGDWAQSPIPNPQVIYIIPYEI